MFKKYNLVSESLTSDITINGMIGAGNGAIAALKQRQDTLIHSVWKRFEDTGDIRYKNYAERLTNMSIEEFRRYLIARGIIVGGVTGVLTGMGTEVNNDFEDYPL